MNVVVVGAGAIGLSCAWQIRAAGHEVTVVDPDPGRAASWVAGGMLAPVAEAYQGEEQLTAFGSACAARWASWSAELAAAAGTDPGYTRRGTLVVAGDADEWALLRPLHDVQVRQDLAAERLSSREARRLEPALSPTVRGALWLPDDHQVDNRRYVRALIDAGGRSGVRFVHERATSVERDRVETDSGLVVRADVVVVATGAWAPPLLIDGAPVTIPVRPVKGQILRVRATGTAVFPTRTVRGLDVYVIPRADGEIAIGATSEEKGFDTEVTALGVRDLLTKAWELLPGLDEAVFVEAVAGLRPGTPDNAPLIGRLGDDGPVVAMGHYRHGILFSPGTAEAVVALLEGREPHATVAPFTPHRFSDAPAPERVTA